MQDIDTTLRPAARWMATLVALLAANYAVAASPPDTMVEVLRRLDALEQQNRQLRAEVAELRQHTATLQTAAATSAGGPAAAAAGAGGTTATAAVDPAGAAAEAGEWASRIRIAGDFRFRHYAVDVEGASQVRERESIRARIAAAIRFNEQVDGEIGIASGAPDPRGASSTLGATSSRKQIGLDLGYARWRPTDELAVIAGKMRQPFERPGLSAFIDNEIRPEGLALTYDGQNGLFGSAFNYWLEERADSADSMVLGGQFGWSGGSEKLKLKAGLGYYDYGSVQGQSPYFGNGVGAEFGNTVLGAGPDAVYAYDYDIGQLFAAVDLLAGSWPVSLFADYGHNFADADDRTDAYAVGVLFGKANAPRRWEFGAMRQDVEKDALFGQWFDSDFGGGVTDSAGQLYRVAWMPMQRVLLNLTYYDTAYNVDVGEETEYDRWQLDFNFTF
jgi:hypothetical protein